MTHISLFSGAGACDAAFHSLGWDTVAFSEVDEAASSVLRYRFDTENVGDITAHDWTKYKGVDVVAGGSPCQSFSVAGLRKGLEDDRGNLTLAFVRAVDAIQPRFVLWENVPGVLSDKTNAFGCFIAALVGADAPLVPPSECGGRWTNAGMASGPERVAAWRVLDAQYFGVAQRRRRVFVVACPRDGADPSEILFESEGVRRDTPPSREAGPGVAALTANGVGTCGADDNQGQAGHLIPEVSRCVTAGYGSRQDYETETMIAQCHGSNVGPMGSLRAGNGNESGGVPFVVHDYVNGTYRQDDADNPLTTSTDASRSAPICVTGDRTHALTTRCAAAQEDGTGRGTPIIAFSSKDHGADAGDISPTLRSMNHDKSHVNGGGQVAVAIQEVGKRTGKSTDDKRAGIGIAKDGDPMFSLQAGAQHGVAVAFDTTQVTSKLNRSNPKPGDPCHPLAAAAHAPATVSPMQVRRLTPVECERLQGYPDDWTRWGKDESGKVYEISDTQRYRMIGNGWALPVVAWIARRIQEHVEMKRAA